MVQTGTMNDRDVRHVIGLLGREETLRVFAALVLGQDGELPAAELTRLESGGLAEAGADGRWRVRPERFRELLRAAPPAPRVSGDERVLRTFLVDGRLQSIPAKRDKRLAVLKYVSRVFEPGVRYPEKDVNVALRAFHDDYAALRRYLIDETLLSREDNVYWRSGGPVDL
jgi:hypothetical protein